LRKACNAGNLRTTRLDREGDMSPICPEMSRVEVVRVERANCVG
jgi:hypothetical protein